MENMEKENNRSDKVDEVDLIVSSDSKIDAEVEDENDENGIINNTVSVNLYSVITPILCYTINH